MKHKFIQKTNYNDRCCYGTGVVLHITLTASAYSGYFMLHKNADSLHSPVVEYAAEFKLGSSQTSAPGQIICSF